MTEYGDEPSEPKARAKRAQPEARLQVAVAAFLSAVLPPGSTWTAVDAGQGRMDFKAAQIRKGRGIHAGWPDIQVIYNGRYHGIELKAGRGTLSPSQISVHAALRAAGATVALCWSVADVEHALRNWGIPLRGSTLTAQERDARLEARAVVKESLRTAKPRQARATKAQIARGNRWSLFGAPK